MKRKIEKAICVFLLFMFLVYSGIFRNYKDPLAVTKYYFEYLKNGEYFLTYPLYKREYFNSNSLNEMFESVVIYNFYAINKIEPTLLNIEDNCAYVQVKIIYKSGVYMYGFIELEKINMAWFIKDVEYKIDPLIFNSEIVTIEEDYEDLHNH